jgi:hypothetical protein
MNNRRLYYTDSCHIIFSTKMIEYETIPRAFQHRRRVQTVRRSVLSHDLRT